jgi:hypothetical protein
MTVLLGEKGKNVGQKSHINLIHGNSLAFHRTKQKFLVGLSKTT